MTTDTKTYDRYGTYDITAKRGPSRGTHAGLQSCVCKHKTARKYRLVFVRKGALVWGDGKFYS